MRNSIKAQVNEILVGLFAVEEDWSKYNRAEEVQKCLAKRKKYLSKSEYKKQADRAERMAEASLGWACKHAKQRRKVERVYWTANPGELQKVLKKPIDKGNPTDVLLQYGPRTHIGISAKSTNPGGSLPAFKNMGAGSLGKLLQLDLTSLKLPYERRFIDQYDLPEHAKARSDVLRRDNDLKMLADVIAIDALEQIRNCLFYHYQSMSQLDIREHLVVEWLNAHENVYPKYIKVTGFDDRVEIEEPIAGTTDLSVITFERLGKTTIGVSNDNERLMYIRAKYNSSPLSSSIKIIAEPW